MKYILFLSMGVPSFFSWWISNYNIVRLDYSSNKKIVLYIDLNGLIHPAVRVPGLKREDMLEAVIDSIDSIITYVDPNSVYLAVDGVAPAAKILHQRSRRHKSIMETRAINEITIRNGLSIDRDPIDFNMISPGTEFMNKLDEYILKRIDELTKPGMKWSKYYITLDGVHNPGEGEHKIMNRIRENIENCTTIICGLDADLLFLSIINCKNAIIVRDNTQFGKKYLYVDVDILYRTIVNNMSTEQHYDSRRYILDYVYICFFLGNDFIPRLSSLRIRNGSLTEIVEIYKNVRRVLGKFLVNSDGMNINRQFMKLFLKNIADIEEDKLINMSIDRVKSIERFNMRIKKLSQMERDIEKLKFIENVYVDKIRYGTNGWKKRYYKYYHYTSDDTSILQICQEYIDMSIWVLRYYQGKHNNWSMTYRHHAAPITSDLVRLFDKINIYTRIVDDKPVAPLVQLMCILPLASANLLPIHLRHKMFRSDINYMYPTKWKNILQDNKYLYECGVRLPDLDIKKIENVVRNSNIVDKVLKDSVDTYL